MRDISWKHVVVIVAFLVLLAAMVSAQKDTVALLAVGMAVLGGLGIIAAQQASGNKTAEVVREQTNGTQARQLDMLETQRREASASLEAQRREFAIAMEAQRLQLVSIIERQAHLLAGAVVPAEVLAISTTPAPDPPEPAEVSSNTYGAAPGPFPTQPRAAA